MKEKIICYCTNVSEKTIRKAIQNGSKNLSDIQKITGACTGNKCKELNPKKRCCSEDIIKILNEGLGFSNNNLNTCHCDGCC